jgi:hypothetical protein
MAIVAQAIDNNSIAIDQLNEFTETLAQNSIGIPIYRYTARARREGELTNPRD